MAWPKSNWIATDLPTYANFNAVALAFATWGGNVDGAGYNLANLGNLSLAAGGKLSMAGQPHISVHNNATVSFPNVTYTSIPWDVTDVTVGGITIASTTRLTAPVAGWYSINALVSFAANATGVRVLRILINGAADTLTRSSGPASSTEITSVCLAFPVALAASDYVEIQAYQDSGGALSTVSNITKACMTMLF